MINHQLQNPTLCNMHFWPDTGESCISSQHDQAASCCEMPSDRPLKRRQCVSWQTVHGEADIPTTLLESLAFQPRSICKIGQTLHGRGFYDTAPPDDRPGTVDLTWSQVTTHQMLPHVSRLENERHAKSCAMPWMLQLDREGLWRHASSKKIYE